MITRCPNCAKSISESDEVCPFCGKDFTLPVKQTRPKSFPSPEPKKPPNRPPEPTQWEEVTPDGILIPPSPPKEPSSIAKNLIVAAALLLAAVGLWRRGGSEPKAHEPAALAPAAAVLPVLSPAPERAQASAPMARSLAAAVVGPQPRAASGLGDSPRGRRGRTPDEPIILDSSPPSMREWRFSGRVFDLLSLQAVPDAELVFTDPESGSRFPIVTDKNGFYRLVLPAASGGYDLAVSHPMYEPKYLPEGNPALKDLPPARRREIGIDSAITLQHKEMFSPGPNGELRRDLALIPLAVPKEQP